jgi:hypothetical protein
MIRFKPPTMGLDIYDVFKTSPGRINPRTGKLVERVEYEALAPWEREERARGRGDFEFADRPRSRRDDDDRGRDYPGPRRDDDRPRSRRDNDDRGRDYPRPRRDYGELFRSGMSGLGQNGYLRQTGEYFGNAVPWLFLGVAAIVALEAAGITNITSTKVG